MDDTILGDKSTLGKRNGNHNEQNSSLGSAPSGEDLKSNNQNFQRSANAEPEQMHIRDTENGEFRFKAKTCTEPKGAFDRMDEKANTYAEVYIQNRKKPLLAIMPKSTMIWKAVTDIQKRAAQRTLLMR
jgi:beta-arabinofuranosyltransferase